MEYNDFLKSLGEIIPIVKFEMKLFDLDVDFPNMSAVAAKLLERNITGTDTDDGLIAWWLYALNCGESEGSLFMPDGTAYRMKTEESLWEALHNKELYDHVIGNGFEQLEFEL